MTFQRLLHATAALLAVSLSACRGSEYKPSPAVPQDAAADTAAAPDPGPTVPGQVALTVAATDRCDPALAGELETIHSAAACLRPANTRDDSVTRLIAAP